MKVWAILCRATQDERVTVESSDRMWFTGEGNDKPFHYSCLENPMNSMRRQNDRTLKDELSRSVGAWDATGDQWRNNSRKYEETEPKQKQHPVLDVTGDGSKVRCCKVQYCIGTWKVKSMNQGKLDGKSECQHFRNWWTKMVWNGWLYLRWPLYLLLWSRIPLKRWSTHHSQEKIPKCSTWMQSQK